MFCKYCGIEIEGAARVCPLCHRPLDEENLHFPIIKKTKKKVVATFGFVYLLIAAIASIICLIVNLVLSHELLWSLSVLALLMYGFILFKTASSKRNAAVKIFFQTAALIVVAYCLEQLSPNVKWAANYAVPFLVILSGILLMILSFTAKSAGPFILNLIFVAILGFVPLIYNVIVGDFIWWPSITCAATSGALFIFAVLYGIFSGKGVLKEELKRKFHL